MEHSVMYSLFEMGYNSKLYTEDEVKKAVTIGWITQDECDEILNLVKQ